MHGGGFLLTNGSNALISNVILSGNTATFDGGGIYMIDVDLTIKSSELINNISGRHGGGLYKHLMQNTLKIENSFFKGNSAASKGGGLMLYDTGTSIIDRTLVIGNESGSWGAGIYVGDEFSLSNSIVFGNSGGAGISLHQDNNNYIVNSVIRDNPNGNVMLDIYTQVNQVQIGFSNIGGGPPYGMDEILSSDNNTGQVTFFGTRINIDPKFISPENDNFGLLPDSRMIDAGHPDSLDIDGTRSDIGALFYDQTGLPLRVQNLKTVQNNQRVELTWDTENQPNIDQYNVYRSFELMKTGIMPLLIPQSIVPFMLNHHHLQIKPIFIVSQLLIAMVMKASWVLWNIIG